MPDLPSSSYTKIYTVNGPSSTSSSSLPTWLTTKTRHKKSSSSKRQRTQHTLGQLELIQDFSFPQSAVKIRISDDGEYAIGTGTYKPMMKVWDLNQLTVKFERVTDAENVDFVMLSRDWTKSLHLQGDRSLQLHTQGGLHHTVRLPVYGRCLAWDTPSCEALIGCTGREVYRFNLEEGRYMSPLVVGADSSGKGKHKASPSEIEGVNCIDINPSHGLWSFGLDGPTHSQIEFHDPRSRSCLTSLSLPSSSILPSSSSSKSIAITSLKSHPTDGLSLAVGTSTGHTLLYDLRSARPFAMKDQGYGEGVRCLDWLEGGGGEGKVMSADSKVIKVWDKNQPSENLFSLNPPSPILSLQPLPHTGLILAALDSPQLSSYYVPDLGPAPKWASFLDGVTEELEEDVGVGGGGEAGGSKGAYRDYKFVDRKELDSLGLSHLIGTPTLKPYMHGFFLALKLYTTARLISNPQSYTAHREALLEKKIAAAQESRIRARRDQPKVNKALAERVRKAEEREKAKEEKRRERLGLSKDGAGDKVVDTDAMEVDEEEEAVGAKNILQDERFKELWENPDFEVDEESREYELLNPGSVQNARKGKTAVEEEAEESEMDSSDGISHSESESEDEEADEAKDSEDSDEETLRPRNFTWVDREEDDPRNKKRSQPRLIAGDIDDASGRPTKASSSFGERLRDKRARGQGRDVDRDSFKDKDILSARRTKDGGMEMSFMPKAGGGRGEDDLTVDYVPDAKTKAEDKRDKRVERFGAGLEKGGYRGSATGEREVTEAERKGRTQRRHPGRSASKNVFRGM